MKIADRTFLISGGVSGLGLATARALHAQGAYVSLLDLNSENGAKIASELGSRAQFFETDVTDTSAIAAEVKALADQSTLEDLFGNGQSASDLVSDLAHPFFSQGAP